MRKFGSRFPWPCVRGLLLLLSHFSRVRLCDPTDGSPPGSPVPGIPQARTLEWVAISFSNAWKWKVKSESEAAQSCLTLCDPMDCSAPGSSVHEIFQARVLEWGAIAFSVRPKRIKTETLGNSLRKDICYFIWMAWSCYYLIHRKGRQLDFEIV